MILEESFFPGEVLSEPLDSPIPDAPPESADRIFYIKSDISTDMVQQDIMNFRFIRRASAFFENREKQMFRTDASRGSWKTPQKLMTIDLAADQLHLACGIVLSSRTCRWLARHQSYYLYLRSDISENGMTEEIFRNAVEEIDSRMVQCLEG